MQKQLVYFTSNGNKSCVCTIRVLMDEDNKRYTDVRISKNTEKSKIKDHVRTAMYYGQEVTSVVWINSEMRIDPKVIEKMISLKVPGKVVVRVMSEGRGGHYWNKCLYEVGIR
jgi:hypothetical protein